jgi:hypothetical protein
MKVNLTPEMSEWFPTYRCFLGGQCMQRQNLRLLLKLCLKNKITAAKHNSLLRLSTHQNQPLCTSSPALPSQSRTSQQRQSICLR